MPANNYTLVANWESDTGTGTGGISPSGGQLTVLIGFERCSPTNPSPPFQSAGAVINCFASFSWFFTEDPMTTMPAPANVAGFTDGDISILTEDDPATEDKIRLGHANRAGVAVGSLRGGSGGVYYLPLKLNPNSAGTVSVTVLSLAASTIPDIGSGDQPVYGPFVPTTASFGYSSLSGTVPTQTKPEVEIITPPDLVYSGATATITLRWDSDIQQDEGRSVGTAADDDIRFTGGTIVDGSFMHVSSTMTFSVNLDGAGTATVRVKADSETDTAGNRGPPQDTSESFQYDTTRSTSESDTGTNVEVIYDSTSRAFNFTTDPVLGPGAGGFAGVSDLRVIGSNVYCTVQMQNRVGTQNELADSEARAAFIRVPNRVSSTAAIIERYDKITKAARSPVLLGNRIYFAEGSSIAPGRGNIKSVTHTGVTERDHGVPWRSRLNNPNALDRGELISYGVHNRISAPLIALGQNLYGVAGYGEPRAAKSTDWASSENPEGRDEESTRYDNWTVFRLGNTFDFRVPVLLTNDVTGYDVLRQLSALTFCYVSLQGSSFRFQPKSQIQGHWLMNAVPADSISTITFDRANRFFPASGTILVHGRTQDEIMTYTGRSLTANELTGVSRAQEGTEATTIDMGARMRFIDHVIDMQDARHSEGAITQLTVRQDLRQLYNIIKIQYGTEEDNPAIARNETSIDENKPRELEISVPLTYHESTWAQWLADEYLKFYGTPQSIIEIQLKPSFYLSAGEFIYLREPLNSKIDGSVYQILSVRHSISPTLTNLTLRSVA